MKVLGECFAPLFREGPTKVSSIGCAHSIVPPLAADRQQQLQRIEKTLTGYQGQPKQPFEDYAPEGIAVAPSKGDAALDLDKSDA